MTTIPFGDGTLSDAQNQQSLEQVAEAFRTAKTGDVAHMLLQGPAFTKYANMGLPQIHGCIEVATPDTLTLWSTYFAFIEQIRNDDSLLEFERSYTRSVRIEPAEVVIPRATKGSHSYGSVARVQTRQGEVQARIDSWFDGIMSGICVESGERFTGGTDFFSPLE